MRCQKPNCSVWTYGILSLFHYRTGTMPVISIKWLVTLKFCTCLKSPWSRDYYTLKNNFLKYQFLQKCALFASWLRTFQLVLCLRVNDVGKICSSNMLCRMTWWTTSIAERILDHYHMNSRIFWSSMTNYCKVPFGQ